MDYDDQSTSSKKTSSRLRVRRRAERLRDLWSVDVRFRPLEEDEEPSIVDSDDWQVTFVDQVSIKWRLLLGAHASWKDVLVLWVLSARTTGVRCIQPKIHELSQLVRNHPENSQILKFPKCEPLNWKCCKLLRENLLKRKFPIWVYLARLFSKFC